MQGHESMRKQLPTLTPSEMLSAVICGAFSSITRHQDVESWPISAKIRVIVILDDTMYAASWKMLVGNCKIMKVSTRWTTICPPVFDAAIYSLPFCCAVVRIMFYSCSTQTRNHTVLVNVIIQQCVTTYVMFQQWIMTCMVLLLLFCTAQHSSTTETLTWKTFMFYDTSTTDLRGWRWFTLRAMNRIIQSCLEVWQKNIT